MNVGLEVAAVILWVILNLKGVGAHRDPTLMALQIDMAGISHDKEVLGLCNAVDLNEGDGKLPRMKYISNSREGEVYQRHNCIKSVGVECL